MIEVTDGVTLDESELDFQFVRSGGPGGQNVNKVATCVQLRFNVASSPSLPQHVRERLIRLAGKRVSQEGVLILTGRRFRTQERNRQDVVDRLVAMIRQAAAPVRARRPTRPSAASKRRRLEQKRRQATRKRERQTIADE